MENTLIAILVMSILPLGLAFAAINDLVSMTIPNRLSAALLISFLVLAPFSGLTLVDIGMNLVAGLTVLSVCFSLFAFNLMGGGDAKLLTAAAFWYGFDPSLLSFLVTVSYVGGAVTLLFLLLRSQAGTVLAIGIPLPPSLVTAKKIPYGIAIAIAGFLTFEQAPIYGLAMNALR